MRCVGGTFRRHPWPYASAFSLVGCYARINVLDGKELLGQWFPPKRIGRAERYLNWEGVPHTVGVDALCRSFDLVPEAVPLAFDLAGWWPSSLRLAAEHYGTGLRFCPECIYQGYHSGLFQLPWWRICPVHEEPFLDRCPNCATRKSSWLRLSREGTPDQLFVCGRCGFDLANSAAIVAARHQGAPDILHRVVGAHRRWTHQFDSRYLVPPLFGPEYWPLKGADVLALVSLPQIPSPVELRPFTEIPSPAHQFPLQIKFESGRRISPDSTSHLRKCLIEAVRGSSQAGSREVPLNWHQAKTLLRLERRLQHAFGQPMARAHWDFLYKHRARTWAKRPPFRSTKPLPRIWEDGFLERGYRRRTQDMNVSSNLVGDSFLMIKDSNLRCLTSVNLVLGLATFLKTQESQATDQQPLRRIADWWYDHALVLALIDATIYATHVNSYIDHSGRDPFLDQCWPVIGLDRQPPGHDWSIAAVGHEDAVAAYIMSWPFGPVVDPERWRGKDTWDRQERWKRDLHLMVEIMKGQRPIDP